MGLYEAGVTRSFTARHSILISSSEGEPSHEHLWRFTATFRSSSLSEPQAVVVDFLDVLPVMDAIASELDGKDLNALDYFNDGRASAERVAEYLANQIIQRLSVGGKLLHRVEVTEAPGCFAAYYPGQS